MNSKTTAGLRALAPGLLAAVYCPAATSKPAARPQGRPVQALHRAPRPSTRPIFAKPLRPSVGVQAGAKGGVSAAVLRQRATADFVRGHQLQPALHRRPGEGRRELHLWPFHASGAGRRTVGCGSHRRRQPALQPRKLDSVSRLLLVRLRSSLFRRLHTGFISTAPTSSLYLRTMQILNFQFSKSMAAVSMALLFNAHEFLPGPVL